MESQLLVVLHYLYPVSLFAALSISHLLLFRRDEGNIDRSASRNSAYFRPLWWLQVCLSFTLVCVVFAFRSILD
jgi:hypothetical protein